MLSALYVHNDFLFFFFTDFNMADALSFAFEVGCEKCGCTCVHSGTCTDAGMTCIAVPHLLYGGHFVLCLPVAF